MGTCASKQATVVDIVAAPPKRDGGPVPAKAPSASESQVLARQGSMSALGQSSQPASRATDTTNRRGSLVFAALTGTADTDHSHGDASSDKQRHNTHLVVLKDSDGHLILGRQANDKPHKHGIAHSAAAMIGQALRSSIPRNNSFDVLRKEGSFTSLQSEHHVDVRSLPELPPALFLAAVLNDVAFFKGIPVIQLATELSALKGWKAAQASRAEVASGIKSINDQQAPAGTAQAGTLGPTSSTATPTASSSAGGPQSMQLAVGAAAPGHASSSPPPPITVPPVPPLHPAAATTGTHASTVPRRGSPLAAASVTAAGGAASLGQSLSAPPVLPPVLPPSGMSVQASRASVPSTFPCTPIAAAQHAVQAATGGGAAAAYSGPSISDLCHAVDKHGDTLLMLAAAAGSADVLELILSLRPVSIKQVKPGTGNTLLHFACDGPAHVAAIYKAMRAHVLHNVELLSDLIAHHTDPSPAVLAAAAAAGATGVGGGSGGSESSGPGIDIDGSAGLSPRLGLEALPSSRPTSGRATPVIAAAGGAVLPPPSGASGAALLHPSASTAHAHVHPSASTAHAHVHPSASTAHAHAIAVQEQLILQSYAHSPEENLAGLHRDLHSLSGVNLPSIAAAAGGSGAVGAGGTAGAAQHSSTAAGVASGGGSAGPAPRGSPPGHGHHTNSSGLSALFHSGAGAGGGRRDSNDSHRTGGAGPHHHDRGSSGVLTSLALNTAQSLAVHGPAPGTELPSVIPGLCSYPHAHAGGGGAHASGGGGLLSPGGGLLSPMSSSGVDGQHGVGDHAGGARNSMPSVAAGGVLAAAAGHGRSSSLSHSVSLGPALAGGTGAGGAPPLHPALGRQPSAFQLPSASATAAAAEGAAAVPTGSHAHPLLTPHHHPPVHVAGPGGALSSPYTTTPALLHMQHGHGGHHFERHHPHAAHHHHHHPGTPGGSHGHGHGHGHGHHTPDDPLFIAGFSYLKALMGYTERFEDGVGDTAGTGAGGGGSEGAAPGGSPSGSESPRSTHRSAGGKAASKELKGAKGGRAQSPPTGAEAAGGGQHSHGPVPPSAAALAASTARRRNSLLGSLMGQGGGSSSAAAAAAGGGAASGSLRVSIPAVSSVGSNLSGVGVAHVASAGAGGAGASALPLVQAAHPLPAPAGTSAAVPASSLAGLGMSSRVASMGSFTPSSSAAAVAAATATAAAQGKELPPVGDDHGCGHGEGGVIPYLSPVYRITSDINTIPVYARFPPRSIQRCVDILLAHGANPRCKNSYGRTPLDIARAHLSQVQLQGPGATAGGVLSGMEDGVILHDPPWSILLGTVGGHADWTCAMDSMNSACASGPMAKCPANVPAIVPGAAAPPVAAAGGASQGGAGAGSAAAGTAPVIMATSHLAHVLTAPVPRSHLTVAAGVQPVPVPVASAVAYGAGSKGAGTGTLSANTTGAPSSGENSPAGSEGSAFTQGSAPSACTAGGGSGGQGGRAVQQIGLSLLPGDSPAPPGGSTDSVWSSGSSSVTGGAAFAEVSRGLGLGITSTVGTVGRGQVGLVPFSLVQGQVQHVVLQPSTSGSTGTAMPTASATAAVPAVQGQQPPALTDAAHGHGDGSDTAASGASGAASQE